MKLKNFSAAILCALAVSASAQTAGPAPARASDIRLTKITTNLISSPEFTYTGAEQFQANQRERWLEVEVEFTAVPDFTEEATFKYYILVGGKLLTGEVTHVSIAVGKGLRSVMYVPPRVLAHIMGARPVGLNSVENVAVQVLVGGAVKDDLSAQRAQAQWFTTLQGIPNMVLNKNETPFAPLYWDRYAQIKPNPAH
ncbi:MAG: hypothetical protein H0X40_17950 [Chthoniobacterales bacterium]|nr:hypothetical protein [Chthoniobacterales bacterium]